MASKFLELRWASMGEGVRNTVIFAPLKGESLEVSAAGHGIVRRGPQWADGEIVPRSASVCDLCDWFPQSIIQLDGLSAGK